MGIAFDFGSNIQYGDTNKEEFENELF